MAKDSSMTTAGELQKTVESLSQKINKKKHGQTAPTSSHVVWEGFNKIIQAHPKTISREFSLAENTQDGFGADRDKKYPMCTMKYSAVFLMLWAYISAGGPGHLV